MSVGRCQAVTPCTNMSMLLVGDCKAFKMSQKRGFFSCSVTVIRSCLVKPWSPTVNSD